MVFPATIAQFVGGQNPGGWLETIVQQLSPGTPLYSVLTFCANCGDDHLFCLFLYRDHF
jgi:hypothetical protein